MKLIDVVLKYWMAEASEQEIFEDLLAEGLESNAEKAQRTVTYIVNTDFDTFLAAMIIL